MLCAMHSDSEYMACKSKALLQAPLVIHNPHALPLFREVRGSKRHLDGRPKDAAERMKPDVGATSVKGTGTGGEIGVTGGTLLTQYVLKNQVHSRGS